MQSSPPSRAQPGRPFRLANTNTTSCVPPRRSTRTPCMAQLTRRELAQLLRALDGRAFAPSVPSDDVRRSNTKKVSLVHLDGPDVKSDRRRCCARTMGMRRPAQKHGALGERARRCNGGARARRAPQQAAARALGAACLVAPATTTAARGRREALEPLSGCSRWSPLGRDIGKLREKTRVSNLSDALGQLEPRDAHDAMSRGSFHVDPRHFTSVWDGRPPGGLGNY
jgi:hypothetical protein